MKLVKKSRLVSLQGMAEKVYEVELCELQNGDDNRFVVNFRYGRRGGTLQEGTKTPSPVDGALADAIFNSVVVAKINKGYQESGVRTLAGTHSSFSSSLRTFLRRIDQNKDSAQRGRMIWRLPQQSDAMLADWLEKGLNPQHSWQENYSRLWGLGRVATSRNLTRVSAFLENELPHLRHLAAEVMFRLGDDDAVATLKQQNLAAMPPALVEAIAGNDRATLDILLPQLVVAQNPQASDVLRRIYLAALDSVPLYQSLLCLLDNLPLSPGLFRGVRYLFKMAEFRLDGPLFALLAWRFDTTREFYACQDDGVYLADVGYIRPSQELTRDDSRLAYSRKTRDYLRRRSWRALRRLGVREDPRYVDMACEVLLRYRAAISEPWDADDDDSGDYPLSVWQHFEDAHFFAWNAILRSNNPQFRRHIRKPLWEQSDKVAGDGRTEAFPGLWDRRPDALLRLLIHCDSEPVCQFALRALKDNLTFCRALAEEDVLRLLARPYPKIIDFTISLLAGRALSPALLVALINSGHPQAVTLALTHLGNISTLFADSALAAQLLLIDNAMLRGWLSGRLNQERPGGIAQTAVQEALLQRAGAADTTFGEEHALWLAAHLASYFSQAPVPTLAMLGELLEQRDDGVQLLAARLLVSGPYSLSDIPEPLVARIHHSSCAAIRAAGVALLGKQSVEGLFSQLALIVDLIMCGEAPEQQACYGLLAQLTAPYPQAVFDQLFPLLFKKERLEGQHQALLAFMTQQLQEPLARLDKDTLWRLLHARSLAAQALGYDVLQRRSPLEFSIRQWVALAGHADLRVRDYALRAFEQYPQVVREHSADALALLESEWQTTREAGFDFFRSHFAAENWTPDLIVNLCDSGREDVQAYGRELLQTFFQRQQGELYLLRLSEHPSATVQTFVTRFFHDYAAGKPEIILALKPCFLAILSQVNRGRLAKDRTLAFLTEQAQTSPQVLEMVCEIFTRLSLTVVFKDKAPLIGAMLALRQRHPDLPLPLAISARPVKGNYHAG
ncbi:hypothetical protein [Entomohabitans teleogrylli]|uniref:hypothetical protein n=1 Tax=Entomohabitans teleogrylli TaxID=1384589 RepID=UPI00073D788B|nr:hypothetical protein [Entomohabitans teleogrylli]